jgi:hypothetical protein
MVRLTSMKKWAFGVHAWRFVTFPVALAVGTVIAFTSPLRFVRALGWVVVVVYASAFVLVVTGALRLPEE